MIKRRTSPGNKLWWIDPTYGLTECLVIEIVRGCIEVSVPRYKCHVPLKPKDLFENEDAEPWAEGFSLPGAGF